MILVSDKLMTPRTTDVVTLIDKDNHYIYVSRNVYDNAVVFNYTMQGNTAEMDAAVLGKISKSSINEDLLAIMLDLYSSAPEPINMLIPFMAIADKVKVTPGLDALEKKMFAYNLIDAVTNSIDIRSYVKLPDAMRAPLVGLQHIANTFRGRIEHAMGMWFTGVELVPIHEVDVVKNVMNAPITYGYVQNMTPVAPCPAPEPVKEESKPLPIPAGSLTTIPAADKDSVEPEANTISEDAYAALMKKLQKIDEDVDAEIKEAKEEKEVKKIEVDKDTADRAEISDIFADALKGL